LARVGIASLSQETIGIASIYDDQTDPETEFKMLHCKRFWMDGTEYELLRTPYEVIPRLYGQNLPIWNRVIPTNLDVDGLVYEVLCDP